MVCVGEFESLSVAKAVGPLFELQGRFEQKGVRWLASTSTKSHDEFRFPGENPQNTARFQ